MKDHERQVKVQCIHCNQNQGMRVTQLEDQDIALINDWKEKNE